MNKWIITAHGNAVCPNNKVGMAVYPPEKPIYSNTKDYIDKWHVVTCDHVIYKGETEQDCKDHIRKLVDEFNTPDIDYDRLFDILYNVATVIVQSLQRN